MYRISTVSEMTGIPRNTLLAWERRYGLLSPERNDSGYRTYSEQDVAKLRRVKEFLDQGYKISEAVALMRRAVPPQVDLPVARGEAQANVRDALAERLLAFDRNGADAVRQRLVLFSFKRSIDEVYLPLLRDVGDAWHRGEVTVAQEHFVTAFVREQMMAMLHSLGAGPEGGPLVVCSGPPGEQHELGLIATAVKLALRGCRVSYLGLDLPPEELAAAASVQRATLVCQSVVQSRSEKELIAYARVLRELVDPEIAVALGGAAVADLEEEVDGVWFVGDVDDLLERLTER